MFNLVVPFNFDSPEDVAQEISKLYEGARSSKWVKWDEFKGLHPCFYDNP